MPDESVSKPVLPEYDRHIFVCVGDKCHADQGLVVYDHLKSELKRRSKDHPVLKRVMRSQSKCLGVCQKGPISVVYPEGVWYCQLSVEKMDQVIESHLQCGVPVQEWTFKPA